MKREVSKLRYPFGGKGSFPYVRSVCYDLPGFRFVDDLIGAPLFRGWRKRFAFDYGPLHTLSAFWAGDSVLPRSRGFLSGFKCFPAHLDLL